VPGRDLDGLVQVGAIDDVVPGDLFLALSANGPSAISTSPPRT
jgi:hypothetical protein